MKLTKTKQKELDVLSTGLSNLFQNLDGACDYYNESLGSNKEEMAETNVESLILCYNEQVDDAKNFCQATADEIEEFYDFKSEGWQEGEKGEAHTAWKEQWQEAADQMEPITFDELVSDGKLGIENLEDLSALLGDLPTEPDC